MAAAIPKKVWAITSRGLGVGGECVSHFLAGFIGLAFPVVTNFLCMMQILPKKQVVAKSPVKAAATTTQKSSSSEDSSSEEEEEEEEQKKPMKKKPGDWAWELSKLHNCSHCVKLSVELPDMTASFSWRKAHCLL